MREDNMKHQSTSVDDTQEETTNNGNTPKSTLKTLYRRYRDRISTIDVYDMIDLWR